MSMKLAGNIALFPSNLPSMVAFAVHSTLGWNHITGENVDCDQPSYASSLLKHDFTMFSKVKHQPYQLVWNKKDCHSNH